MKEKIRGSVKTAFSKYGLKDSSIEKLVNIVESRISKMGTIENEDEVIKSEVALAEPYVAIIQPEIDALRGKTVDVKTEEPAKPEATTEVTTNDVILAKLNELFERQDRIEQADALRQNEIKQADALKEKQEQRNQHIENIRKTALAKDDTNEESGWALNAGVLETAIRLIQIEDADTQETIERKCKQEYNVLYKNHFGTSGAIPGVGGGGNSESTDWSEEKRRLQERGSLPKDEK